MISSCEYRCAIGVTLNVFGSGRRKFRKEVERTLLPQFAALSEAKRVAAVLPFHHRPLRAREDGNRVKYQRLAVQDRPYTLQLVYARGPNAVKI